MAHLHAKYDSQQTNSHVNRVVRSTTCTCNLKPDGDRNEREHPIPIAREIAGRAHDLSNFERLEAHSAIFYSPSGVSTCDDEINCSRRSALVRRHLTSIRAPKTTDMNANATTIARIARVTTSVSVIEGSGGSAGVAPGLVSASLRTHTHHDTCRHNTRKHHRVRRSRRQWRGCRSRCW
jgi:hypothetical protein